MTGIYAPAVFAADGAETQQTKGQFTTHITGDISKDTEYADAGVLESDGNYNFTQDTVILIDHETTTPPTTSSGGYPDPYDASYQGVAVTNTNDTINLNAGSNKLTFKMYRTADPYNPNAKSASTRTYTDAWLMRAIDNQKEGSTVNITAAEINFDLDNTQVFHEGYRDNPGYAEAIYINNEGANASKVNITGDTNITAYGRLNAKGASVSGNSQLVINGDVTMKKADGSWGISNRINGKETSMAMADAAMNVNGLYAAGENAQIDVNGDVDLAIDGTGVIAVDGGATININGGGTIKTNNVETDYYHYALAADSATVNMNMVDGAAGKNKVDLTGNIGVLSNKQSSDKNPHTSEVNVALTTADSQWTGLAVKQQSDADIAAGRDGHINLYLQNGATWNNEKYGATLGVEWASADKYTFTGSKLETLVGGSDAASAGYIVQKDNRDVTINNYSGHTVIVYEHTGNGQSDVDYDGGDTIIKKAAADSGVILSTSNNGITDINDTAEVTAVLNALAGKLTYSEYVEGVKNLDGKVQIASGLTASDKSLSLGQINFNDQTGQGSFAGEFIDGPQGGQTETSFTSGITGNQDTDIAYVDGGVMQEDGTYKFTQNSSITLANGAAIGGLNGASAINIEGKELTVKVGTAEATGGNYGIQSSGASKEINITADKLIVDMVGNEDKTLYGIYNTNTADYSEGARSEINIKGNVELGMDQGNYSRGVYAYGNSAINFAGNLDINMENDADWMSPSGATAINATGGGKFNQPYVGASVVVDGDLNIDITNQGTGILAQNYESTVDVNGNVEINTSKNAIDPHYAVAAKWGTVNINKDGKDKKVVLNGNIGLLGSSPYNYPLQYGFDYAKSAVNLGLTTADSKFNGVIVNTHTDTDSRYDYYGEANIILQNQATWTNEAYGNTDEYFNGSTVTNFTGDSDASKAGAIVQKDKNALTFENYSGNTVVIYEHEVDDAGNVTFDAGDTVVEHAAEGSGIVMSTDNKGITISDTEQVQSTLNALAGKLLYSGYVGGERNLDGKVQIASGLTSSSAAMMLGDIQFGEDGRGSLVDSSVDVVDPPEHQEQFEFTSAITGDKLTDFDYVFAGVLKDDDTYKFEGDSDITITNNGSALEAKEDINIEATESTLNFVTEGANGMNIYTGFGSDESYKVNIKAEQVNVKAESSGSVNGIKVENIGIADEANRSELNIDGNVSVNASGEGWNTVGMQASTNAEININGNVTMKGEDGAFGIASSKDQVGSYSESMGIYAKGGSVTSGEYPNFTSEHINSEINISGNVDLAVEGGAIVASNGGVVNIDGGGTIKVNDEAEFENYSVVTSVGTVNINKEGKENLVVDGNMLLEKVTTNGDDKSGNINIAFATSGSEFNGVIVNKLSEQDVANGYTGSVNMTLANGATWTNEAYGVTSDSFNGSTVANLVGGDKGKSGYIIQNDKNDLTIDSYSGNTVIIYEHKNAGADVTDYEAGDVKINSAAANSGVVLSTDNSGIDMKDDAAIEATLGALAQKLYYANAGTDENLKGQVQIASGLTANSASLNIGDIKFDANNGGIGNYVEGSMHEAVISGDDESYMMKGARSAMMTSMLAWRDNASDIYDRTTALRDGKEEGAWARTFGGKTEYDGNGVNIDNSYWAGQVGYDRNIGDGWNFGVALDYQDGDASYLLGGKGDNSLYGIGFYGTKDLGNGAYLDVAAKAAELKMNMRFITKMVRSLREISHPAVTVCLHNTANALAMLAVDMLNRRYSLPGLMLMATIIMLIAVMM